MSVQAPMDGAKEINQMNVHILKEGLLYHCQQFSLDSRFDRKRFVFVFLRPTPCIPSDPYQSELHRQDTEQNNQKTDLDTYCTVLLKSSEIVVVSEIC